MTALAQPSGHRGRADRLAARRAVTRWAGRMFRREWRGQLLVVALLVVAVAGAVGSITVVYNTGAADNAEFGSATQLLRFDGSDPEKLQAGLRAAENWFGTTEVIGHRSAAVPGSVETVDFRAQDPDGAYGRELLAVRRGRYPVGPGEAAVTDGVAELLRLQLGSALALDGQSRKVVGIVENPRDLGDDFALVDPSSAAAPQNVSVLVDAGADSSRSFVDSLGRPGDSAIVGTEDRSNDRAAATLAMFAVATVFLLLALLIAAAGFAVVAQRRLRQLGMLAAMGAAPKHLRLVLLANAGIVGAIAAVCGTIAGLGLWMVAAPTLESAVGHRVDRLSVPWGLVVLAVLVTVLGATAAAWWPARAVARLPVMLALSGRPPRPRPARHAAIAAAVLIAVGIGCLALSSRDRPPLIVAGIVATIVGCLLLGPAAIRIFAGLARRLPVASRLALRDLVRYQARSGAALAAVTLALGIAATVVVIASAEEAESAAQPPNLSDRQIRIYLGPPSAPDLTPVDAPAQLDRMAAAVRQLATELDGAAVIPLRKAREPGAAAPVIEGTSVYPGIDLARRDGQNYFKAATQVYVATPAVLRYFGIEPAGVDPGTDFLVDPRARVDDLVIPSLSSRNAIALTDVQRVQTGKHLLGNPWGDWAGDAKPAFITAAGVRRHGWKQIPAGWLVESSRPLTGDQIADAREQAAAAGLTIEVRRGRSSESEVMAIVIAAGALLALGILALTVGLIRAESARDVRILSATGAGSGTRRTLTAATAGALALLGAVLGVAGAYAVLTATYYDDLGYLSHVPVLYLGLAIVGVPLAATAAGWLLAGREPATIARPVID